MNMWLCTSFKIHDFKEFHDIYKRFESHIIHKNELNLRRKNEVNTIHGTSMQVQT